MSAARSKPLDYLAITLIAVALLNLIFGVLQTRAFVKLISSHGEGDGFDLTTLYRVSAVVHLVGFAAIIALCLGCRPGSLDSLNRALWTVAIVLTAIAGLEVLAGLITDIAKSSDPLLWKLYRKAWFRILMAVLHLGSIAVITVAAMRRMRERSALILGIVALVALGATAVAPYLIPETPSAAKAAWLRFFGATGLAAVAMIATAALCRLAARSGGGSQLIGPLEGSPRWTSAADGLKLYGTALVWRLVITLGGYLLLLLAILGKNVGLAELLMWALPLGALATGALMFAGIIRFAGQPPSSPGRPAAIFAAVAMGIALLIEFYTLTLVLGAIGDGPREYEAANRAREAIETAQKLGPWTLALSFSALGALLFSFAAIAKRLAEGSLTRRVYGVGGWLIAIAVAAVGLQLWLSGPMRRSELGTVVVFALMVAIAALAVLIAYIGLVRDIESRLRQSGEGASVPTAVVVEE